VARNVAARGTRAKYRTACFSLKSCVQVALGPGRPVAIQRIRRVTGVGPEGFHDFCPNFFRLFCLSPWTMQIERFKTRYPQACFAMKAWWRVYGP
jgi:hypothetical protein